MNILIPDSWLRDFLKTNATPNDIKRCLSLCGPSVERIHPYENDFIYDIEITSNRVDAFSVMGIAREAAVILPQFGYQAEFITPKKFILPDIKTPLDIEIINNPDLCRRILAIKMADVTIGDSPEMISKRLEKVGQRPINNLIDITNYVMWEIGHPIHAFDYDRLTEKKILVREAKKKEILITLDGKKHFLLGGEIIFDDGKGNIIDLPGIMGTKNSVVTDKTRNVLLFIESSDAVKIRLASMGLGIRSQAAVINEKEPDPELAQKAIFEAIKLYQGYASAQIGSKLFDCYSLPQKPHSITVRSQDINGYLGTDLEKSRIENILKPLGFKVISDNKKELEYHVTPPSFRLKDCTIAEDIIEEIARIYGYHNIIGALPSATPPQSVENPLFRYEEELKIRLRDWGYTENYTYSMISEDLMKLFNYNLDKTYKISNPLSSDWEYMRPSLLPSMLISIKENLHLSKKLSLFEISNIYVYQEKQLPLEQPIIIVAKTGNCYFDIKGLSEAIFQYMRIPYIYKIGSSSLHFDHKQSITFNEFGQMGYISSSLLNSMGIKEPVIVLELDLSLLIQKRNPRKSFVPIPKYPPSYEDLALVIQPNMYIGPILETIKEAHPLVYEAELLDSYDNIRTIHVTYLSEDRSLTAYEIAGARAAILTLLKTKFNLSLKTI